MKFKTFGPKNLRRRRRNRPKNDLFIKWGDALLRALSFVLAVELYSDSSYPLVAPPGDSHGAVRLLRRKANPKECSFVARERDTLVSLPWRRKPMKELPQLLLFLLSGRTKNICNLIEICLKNDSTLKQLDETQGKWLKQEENSRNVRLAGSEIGGRVRVNMLSFFFIPLQARRKSRMFQADGMESEWRIWTSLVSGLTKD